MKAFPGSVFGCSILVFLSAIFSIASAADTNPPPRLTVELRDGSRVVGESVEKYFKFHSSLPSEIKLALKDIRSLECVSSNSAKLSAVNGDTLTVAFLDSKITVKTSFGQVDLPVNSVRKFSVSAGGKGSHPPGLVALWSGEGDGNDAVGGHTATLTDITFAEGKVGQAFSFNGTSSSIRIPASPALDVGVGDGFTITAWIKPSNVDGLHPILYWSNPDQVQLWISARPDETGVLRGNIMPGKNGGWLVSQQGVLASGVFQHIAMTYDKASSMSMLYVNGAMVAQHQLSPQMAADTKGDFWFSKIDRLPGSWSTNRAFVGLMDEVAIYNRALSAEEIQTLCTEQNNGQPLPQPTPSTGWRELMFVN